MMSLSFMLLFPESLNFWAGYLNTKRSVAFCLEPNISCGSGFSRDWPLDCTASIAAKAAPTKGLLDNSLKLHQHGALIEQSTKLENYASLVIG
ncbi:MAG: hypothetical protein HY016_07340 [Nitrosomonadales bacterium]|nr:hypothetical protein [Nitrosomonadales bacterium]